MVGGAEHTTTLGFRCLFWRQCVAHGGVHGRTLAGAGELAVWRVQGQARDLGSDTGSSSGACGDDNVRFLSTARPSLRRLSSDMGTTLPHPALRRRRSWPSRLKWTSCRRVGRDARLREVARVATWQTSSTEHYQWYDVTTPGAKKVA